VVGEMKKRKLWIVEIRLPGSGRPWGAYPSFFKFTSFRTAWEFAVHGGMPSYYEFRVVPA
jgi:hypothetical protein